MIAQYMIGHARPVKTPSKYVSRKFLAYLKNNHYISKGGVEYNAQEVDEMFNEKCERLGALEYFQDLKREAEHLQSGGCLPPMIVIEHTERNKHIAA